MAFNFHQVPLLGIPTTLVTLPVLPGILLGGLATAVLAALWAPLGWAVGWVPWLLGEYLELVVDGVARVSWSVVEVEELGPALVWGYYSLLGGVMAVLLRGRWLPAAGRVAGALWRGPATPRHRLGVLLAVGLLTGALWVAAFARPDDRLHLYVLDVGQGDAILVRTPGGHNLLVDGGPDPRVTLTAIDQILPYNDRTIDVALLSHAHADHLNGLMAMAERGRLERMVEPPPVAGDDDEALWRGELEDAGLELVQGSAGMTIALPDGVRLEVLHPPLPPNSGTSSDVNNNSLVVLVSYGRAAALLPGDLQAESELALLDSGAGLSAQVLKAAHHGSDTSSTEEFLRAVLPLAAVVSVGEGNLFGHPSAEVVARLRAVLPTGALYQTAEDGTVELTTDGVRWWVKTGR